MYNENEIFSFFFVYTYVITYKTTGVKYYKNFLDCVLKLFMCNATNIDINNFFFFMFLNYKSVTQFVFFFCFSFYDYHYKYIYRAQAVKCFRVYICIPKTAESVLKRGEILSEGVRVLR